ncbi:uncharacterized protein BJ171DRAFT_7979 [Polychytrium aggregatum]|uniref:uncharacterized protein n=1 Tax=Polychytrium aggregatum TaxID=110093 RepID=UPI0022FDF72C|nr:uncharacterized protein BJ171DRAFT_7979 [Polychytrium aggregatum]KAI9209817.1 hypothetical protein BJ171DRAFT_7979 [Polychytrium aggregatum]
MSHPERSYHDSSRHHPYEHASNRGYPNASNPEPGYPPTQHDAFNPRPSRGASATAGGSGRGRGAPRGRGGAPIGARPGGPARGPLGRRGPGPAAHLHHDGLNADDRQYGGPIDERGGKGERMPTRAYDEEFLLSRRKKEHPCRTLFVRNIAYDTKGKEITDLFKGYGEIKSVFDLISSRGMIFITFYDLRDSERAKGELQDTFFRDRQIDIHFSLPKESDLKAADAGPDKNQATIVISLVGGSQPSLSIEEIHALFGKYGDIKEVRAHAGQNSTPGAKAIEFFNSQHCENAFKALANESYRSGRLHLEYVWDLIPTTRRSGQFSELGGHGDDRFRAQTRNDRTDLRADHRAAPQSFGGDANGGPSNGSGPASVHSDRHHNGYGSDRRGPPTNTWPVIGNSVDDQEYDPVRGTTLPPLPSQAPVNDQASLLAMLLQQQQQQQHQQQHQQYPITSGVRPTMLPAQPFPTVSPMNPINPIAATSMTAPPLGPVVSVPGAVGATPAPSSNLLGLGTMDQNSVLQVLALAQYLQQQQQQQQHQQQHALQQLQALQQSGPQSFQPSNQSLQSLLQSIQQLPGGQLSKSTHIGTLPLQSTGQSPTPGYTPPGSLQPPPLQFQIAQLLQHQQTLGKPQLMVDAGTGAGAGVAASTDPRLRSFSQMASALPGRTSAAGAGPSYAPVPPNVDSGLNTRYHGAQSKAPPSGTYTHPSHQRYYG